MFVYDPELVLVLLVTLLPSAFGQQLRCPPSSSCNSSGNIDTRFYYEIYGKQVTIDYTENKLFSVSCIDAKDLAADDPSLPVFEEVVNVDSVKFAHCALPSGSYANALAALNISVTKSLQIELAKALSPLVNTHSAGLKVDELSIISNSEPLPLIEDNFLSELHQLKSLVMYNLNISTPQTFLALPASLEELDLDQLAFPRISDDTRWLERLRSLTWLRIYDSNDEKKMSLSLPKLTNFPNLTTIIIDGVPINLSKGCLGGSTLRNLTLKSCGLSQLKSDTFKDVNLTLLNLDGNGFTYLPNRVFSSLEWLETLNLSNNELKAESLTRTLPVLKQLLNLIVKNNPLGTLCGDPRSITEAIGESSKLPSSLQTLDLRQTEADRICVDWLEDTALTYIDLADNKINGLKYKDLVMFRTHATPVVLNLNGNELKRVDLTEHDVKNCIEAAASRSSRARVILNLSTAIPCDCRQAWFREALRSCKSLLSASILKCVANTSAIKPPETYGTLQEYTPDELLCRHRDTCVPGCSCWNRMRGNATVMWCEGPLPKEPIIWPASINKWPLVLHAPGTGLTKIPPGRLEELYISNNSIISLDNVHIPDSLRFLDVRDNLISQISEAAARRLLQAPANQLSVYLTGNPLQCDCNNSAALLHLKTASNQIKDLNELYCEDSRLITGLTTGDLCPSILWPVLAGVLSVITLVVLITIALMPRLRLYVKQYCINKGIFLKLILNVRNIPDDASKDNDVFVSFATPDSQLATNLMEDLQARGYTTMDHHRDFHPGCSILENIAEFIKRSRIILLLVTDNFEKSEWCMHEFRTAHSVSIKGDTARVLVLLYPLTDPKNVPLDMQVYLQSNTYIKPDDVHFFRKIEAILGKRRHNATSELPIQIEIEETLEPMPVQSEQEMELVPLAGNDPEAVHPVNPDLLSPLMPAKSEQEMDVMPLKGNDPELGHLAPLSLIPVQSDQIELVPLPGNDPKAVNLTLYSSPTKQVKLPLDATLLNAPLDRPPTSSTTHLPRHMKAQFTDLIEFAPRIETVAS